MHRNTHAMLMSFPATSLQKMLIFTNTSPTPPSLISPTLPSITQFFFSLFRSVNDSEGQADDIMYTATTS